jgi:flagella basal body P-ring formation protein FlgA
MKLEPLSAAGDGMPLASVKPMIRTSRFCACFLTLLMVPAGARAEQEGLLPVDELRRAAENLLTERLRGSGTDAIPRVTASALDPRTRLQRCKGELQGIMPATIQASARMTVGVRCAAPAWTIYVPVTVETELQVLVMRVAAARDSSPVEGHVELQLRRVPGVAADYLTHPDQLRGRHFKVPVGPGTALSTGLLAADILVKRGQRVTLIANVGGLEVRAQGEAIADATGAGRVRVLNLSSRKIVEGQVESSDRVRVSL